MPKVSLVASSIRPHLWLNFYQSLLSNDQIEYEVIFVGPNRPDFTLPNCIHYIYSTVKPTQCYEIGFRQATGDFINWTADDVIYDFKALDLMYQRYMRENNKYIVFAFNCIENGSPTSEGHRIDLPPSPRMAPIGFMDMKFFRELGGYDRRFICGQAENDVVMRVRELGGKVEICQEAGVHIEHNKLHGGKSKFRTEDGYPYHLHDKSTLISFWLQVTPGQFKLERQKSFEPFVDENILITTQGEGGEWI
jgi:hypothetical protein